ncbi:hypothetical protein [Streptomyces sp. NPDC005795]|uniref:hypothetical protein n=1 Tax=Streptomyces sp. NPDC005795 TaxID=3154677 RepID=UPI0033E72640
METDRSPGREPGPGTEELLIRLAMERTAEGAPSLPDLVPAALVQGRRRRTRARAAVGAGMTAVVALGVFGVALPMWGPGGGGTQPQTGSVASRTTFATPAPSLTAVPLPVLKPVHIEPSAGETSMADLPASERLRQQEFQQKVASLLGELLHEPFDAVRPVDLTVSRYQAEADGNAFPVVFSVRPQGGPEYYGANPVCRDNALKGFRCKTVMLPGGIKVRAITAEGNGSGAQTLTNVELKFVYGDSTVRLSVDGDDASMVSAPLGVDQLLAAAGDARFLKLVQYANEHPMEDKEHSVRGG